MVSRLRLIERSDSEFGATITEAALIFPVVFLLLFGIIQYGILIAADITVKNACAVAAREATIFQITPAEIALRGQEAGEPLLDSSIFQVTATPGTVPDDAGGTRPAYRIHCQYPLQLMIAYVVPGSGGTFTLSADAVARY